MTAARFPLTAIVGQDELRTALLLCAIDPALVQNDPGATVEAHQSDVHVSVEIKSSLPHAIIKHRMTLLIGKHWTLRDVSAV